MAALPSPTQVAGTHCAIYEAYYHQVDPSGTGAIQALDAARFLKKSRLSDVVLSKIWDLSDPNGKGYLDKTGLFVALKLVALAQAGKDINMSNIHSETPPPKVGELPKVPPSAPPARPAAPSPAPAGDWTMKPQERDKYSQLFDSLQPNNGLIAGNKVKGVLMESKLPLDTLGKIWDLADQDKDGMLDRHEFMVAMHLVYKALEKHAIPTSLPAELRARRAPSRPPSRPASRPPSRAASPPPRPVPPAAPAPPSNASLLDGLLDFSSPVEAGGAGWPPAGAELAQFAAQFRAADADRDGFVSGLEIKDTFLNTGLSHQTLAHIWALCDRSGSGRLSWAEFALGMWLVARARAGLAPALPHNYQPLQDIKPPEPAPTLGPQPTPEMEAIVREIDALAKERLAIETELTSKERELGAANSEADGLQSELDTLTATLKQLENQKGEAQKRLNDLKTQVEKLRCQVAAQEAAAADTEAELETRRAARDSLRARDDALRSELRQHDAQLDDLSHQLTRTALAISQANIKIAHLEEQLQLITSTTEALAGAAPRGALALSPQYSAHHLDRLVRGATPSDALEEDFSKSNGFANGPSAFDSDPFKDAAFPAPAADPFAPAALPGDQSGFNADPFGGSADPFAGDAFAPAQNNAKDDSAWENDPFAVLHAPTRAPGAGGAAGGAGGAGGPALPPKRHKTPPPRPAPPRPNPPHKNTRAAMDFTDDPFKDYRYEDPFNIEDPFADVTDSRKDALRPTSVAGFETDDFFGASAFTNGGFPAAEKRSGRVSAPPSSISHDPFSSSREIKPNKDSWSAWPNDNWADDSAWAQPSAQKGSSSVSSQKDAWAGNSTPSTNDWTSKTDNWANKTDNWANKTENWATDWNTDQNKNLNETWPSGTLPAKKEKSPKPVKYAKSLVHTIGGIGRTKQKKAKAQLEARSAENLPSEEQQWAWAAAESRRLEQEAENRRRQEDAELQLALAISRQEK